MYFIYPKRSNLDIIFILHIEVHLKKTFPQKRRKKYNSRYYTLLEKTIWQNSNKIITLNRNYTLNDSRLKAVESYI